MGRRSGLNRVFLFWCALIVSMVALLGVFVVVASPAAQTDPAQTFLFDVRADLEVLADEVFGATVRPPGWIANFDPASPTAATDLWYDNELLASQIYGGDTRPADWLGATVSSQTILVENVRHDLELAADEVFGLNTRPDNWRGAPILLRCSRTLRNTLSILGTFYRLQSTVPESALNYCLAVQAEIEDEIINIIFGTPGEDGSLIDPNPLLSGVRGDLERLGDELYGLNERPAGYSGNRDVNTPSFVGDLFLDLNAIVDLALGDIGYEQGERPVGWIGTVSSLPAASYYSLRHDLELLTDTTFSPTNRPTGWQGILPEERCMPQVRYLRALVEANYPVTFTDLDPNAADYCNQLSEAVNGVVENPPVIDTPDEEATAMLSGSSNFAFTFLDVAASQYMGIMPGGTLFRPLYRNFGLSNMMFIVGTDFALFVDRRFTSVEETTFNGLPSIENANPVAYCDANWCNGPMAPPTPTGSGPLIQVLIQNTPQATPNTGELEITKQLVSWNYVRVTYVQDNPAARTAQVTLEICAQPAENATACEPVFYVFDNETGAEKPALGQFNGLNLYEFRYGYTTSVVIEGETRYSTDVWISDPTIR